MSLRGGTQNLREIALGAIHEGGGSSPAARVHRRIAVLRHCDAARAPGAARTTGVVTAGADDTHADETLHALPGVLTATIGIILLCGVWAWVLTHWLPIDFPTAFLATSPGGLDSVAIIAVGSRADVSFVLAVQTLRLFVVLATGPILAKWIARAAPGETP